MAVDLLREIHEGGSDKTFERGEYTRSFIGHTTQAGDRESLLEAALFAQFGVKIGAGHPEDASSWCRGIRWNRSGQRSRGMWRGEAMYSNGPLSQAQQDKILIADPTARPTICEVNRIGESVAIMRDRYGKAFENACEVPFDPAVSREVSRVQLVFRKNFTDIPNWWWALGDCINENELTIGHQVQKTLPKRSALFRPMSAPELFTENDISYCEVSWMLDVRAGYRKLKYPEVTNPDALDERKIASTWSVVSTEIIIPIDSDDFRRPLNWDAEYPNMGTEAWDGAESKNYVPFYTSDSKRVTSPRWLNRDGVGGGFTSEFFSNYIWRGIYDLASFAPIAGYVG
jgi:hypothetical protein